jgi:hypothetical protein
MLIHDRAKAQDVVEAAERLEREEKEEKEKPEKREKKPRPESFGGKGPGGQSSLFGGFSRE